MNLIPPQQKKTSWLDPVYSIFSCCSGKQSTPLVDLSAEVDNENEDLWQNIRSLELQLLQAEQKVSAVQVSSQNLQSKLQSTESTLSTLRKNAPAPTATNKLAQEIVELQKKEALLNRSIDNAEKNRLSLKKQIESASSNAASSQNEFSGLQKKIDSDKNEVEQLRNQVKAQQVSVASTEKEMAELEKKVRDLQAKLSEREQEFQFTASMKDKLDGGMPASHGISYLN